ncbi:MAG: alpha/beta hydrolase [Fervidobacterium sp.]|jgi:pimeloyl-ACP methyl ester carboxylesterase
MKYIYEYDENIPFNLQREEKENYTILKFTAVYEPDIPESKTIYVYQYHAQNPWMALIFLHGIGNGHVPYLMWFGEKFAKHGIETFFLIHPYHRERAKPEWEGGEPFFHHSPAHCVVRFHQAIKDVRRTLDLIESEENFASINDLPIGIMGFSFGGMIATMALALDKRIKAGILSFTGGDWRWINWYSPYVEPVRQAYALYSNEWGCKDENRCVQLRNESRRRVHNLKSIEEIFELKPTCFHYDPISYAKFVQQPVLLFQGIFDKVIPRKASDSLFRLLPNAKKITVPSGHKSSYMFRRFILKYSVKFFKDTFNASSSTLGLSS